MSAPPASEPVRSLSLGVAPDAPLARELRLHEAGEVLIVQASVQTWRPQLSLATAVVLLGYLVLGLAAARQPRLVPPAAPLLLAGLTTYLSFAWLHAATTLVTVRAAPGRLEWTLRSWLWRRRRRWQASEIAGLAPIAGRHLSGPVYALRLTQRQGPPLDLLYCCDAAKLELIVQRLCEGMEAGDK